MTTGWMIPSETNSPPAEKAIKMHTSNLMRMARFWNNFIRYSQS